METNQDKAAPEHTSKSRFRVGDIVARRGSKLVGRVTQMDEWGQVFVTFHEIFDSKDLTLVRGVRRGY